MPTSKNILDTRLLGFISTAWLMLLAETICPSLSYDFSFLVAGLLSGYLFVMVKDWQQHRRRSA